MYPYKFPQIENAESIVRVNSFLGYAGRESGRGKNKEAELLLQASESLLSPAPPSWSILELRGPGDKAESIFIHNTNFLKIFSLNTYQTLFSFPCPSLFIIGLELPAISHLKPVASCLENIILLLAGHSLTNIFFCFSLPLFFPPCAAASFHYPSPKFLSFLRQNRSKLRCQTYYVKLHPKWISGE